MNHKMKLGYMALGAGILAIGIIIGQVVTPDIEAQNNGVFDKITCRSLKVVDKHGNSGIMLGSDDKINEVIVFDLSSGQKAIWLSSEPDKSNIVGVYNSSGTRAISLVSTDRMSNQISLFDIYGQKAIGLSSFDEINSVQVFNPLAQKAIMLGSKVQGSTVQVYDKGGNIKWSTP